MADTTEVADPSMEEILASIRKIISDENPPEEATAPEVPAVTAVEEVLPVEEPEEDVLELTQIVQEDGSVVDLNAVEPEPVAPPAAMPAFTPAPVSTESLVSAPVAETAASALSALANTVEIERLASAPMGASYVGNGSRTLEDMVIELMRPLLKDWLDQNLTAVVERLVQKEIEHIARRS